MKGTMDITVCALFLCISLRSVSAISTGTVSDITNPLQPEDPNAECALVCGTMAGVNCEFVENDGAKCSCEEGKKKFHNKESGCKDSDADCEKVCGTMDGVKCEFVENDGAKCSCEDGKKKFHNKESGCKDPAADCEQVCGKIDGVKCDFVENKGAKCSCEDGEKKFHNKESGCKDPDAECEQVCGTMEGVKCEFVENEGANCSCEDGKKKFHNKESGCKDPDAECEQVCGKIDGVKCKFVESDGAKCSCKESTENFVSKSIGCKKTCDDEKKCLNGGECEPRDGGRFCKCPEGTEGSFCELYTLCKDKECGDEAKCELGTDKKAVCRCDGKDLTFDVKDKKCKETCDDEKKCLNDGKCVTRDGGKFCKCPEGTEGSFCELHTLCKNKNCGDEAKCELDTDKKVAVCKCEEESLSFDAKDKKCKETCDDEKKCLNSGKCEARDGGRFCKCPEGTEGSFCELYSACKDKECGDEAKCEVDSKKKVTTCRCKKETLSFDGKDKKCKETCGDEKKCLNGGKCKARDGGKFCDCADGTEGFFCQLYTACRGKDCGTDAKCVLDGDKAVAICRCGKAGFTFDEKDKKCKGVTSLSRLSIFAISFTVIICISLIVAAIIYRRRKSGGGPRYTMRFWDRTVSFESALYDANSETLEFAHQTRH